MLNTSSSSHKVSSGERSKTRYYLDELKLSLPIALAAFAFATVAFLAVDGAKEAKDAQTRVYSEGQKILAQGLMQLNAIRGSNESRIADMIQVVRDTGDGLDKHSLGDFDGAFAQAIDMITRGGAIGAQQAAQLLYSVQLSISTTILGRGQPTLQNYLNLALATVAAIGKRIQMNVLHSSEMKMTPARAVDGASICLGCSPLGQQFLTTFTPSVAPTVTCDSAAAVAAGATSLNTNILRTRFAKIDAEFLAMQDVLMSFSDSQGSAADPNYSSAMGLKLAALFVAAISAIFGFYLVVDQHRSLKEHSVVESDFMAKGTSVCLQPSTMRVVDELCMNIGCLEDSPPSEAPQQTELNIRKAIKPLTMIRPFVPSFMFVRSLRSRSIFNANAKNLLRNRNLLNLTIGMRRKTVGLLFVGLRRYNVTNAEVDTFNELFVAVRLACEHFQGNIVQVNSDGILLVFSQGQINEDQDNEQVKDGEVLAAHAAFAILAMCQAQMDVDDADYVAPLSPQGLPHLPHSNMSDNANRGPIRARKEAIKISMVISQAHTLQGLTSFHVSKQFSILSPSITSALTVEPITDLHDCSILTTHNTVALLDGFFLTRPVHYHPTEGSVFHVMAEEPADDEDAPKNDELAKEMAKLREKVQKWSKVWEKYEILMASERPTFELLEESHRDLEGYKVFHMTANEHDSAYETAVANVKKVAQTMGVSLGNTVEED